MLIGVAAALLGCVGYGAASVLQAYGARNSTAAASGRGSRTSHHDRRPNAALDHANGADFGLHCRDGS